MRAILSSGRLRAALRPLAAATLIGAVAACGGDPSGPLPVAGVIFAAPADTLLIGQRRTLDVSLEDANGRPVSQATISWTSADSLIVAVNDSGTVEARRLGETDVTATANGISATLHLVVRPVPVAAVTLYAPATEMTVGDRLGFTAMARDSVGNPLEGRRITFRSSDPGVASVTDFGDVTALAAGEADITAESEGRSSTVKVRVIWVPVATVVVSPATLDVVVGRTAQLSTVLWGPAQQRLTNRLVTFRSSSPDVATVTPSGTVQAVALGTTTIVAESEGKTGKATVTVIATPPQPNPVNPPPLPPTEGDGSYRIQVAWEGMPDSRAGHVVDAVIARWGRVITGDLPDITADVPNDACFDGQLAERVTVDDLLIYVRVVTIDGPNGTLARAGPCFIRSSSSLPVIGVVELDDADLDRNAGLVESVLLHEFGHVLGIGTLWSRLGLLHGSSGDDPLFLGATSKGAYGELGAGDALVPVENTGGPGTRLGHWRESVFRTELMTGWIGSGSNPMSRITVSSLRDLGYRVDMNAADYYALPGFVGANPRIEGGERIRIVDELITPKFVVDRDGVARRISH